MFESQFPNEKVQVFDGIKEVEGTFGTITEAQSQNLSLASCQCLFGEVDDIASVNNYVVVWFVPPYFWGKCACIVPGRGVLDVPKKGIEEVVVEVEGAFGVDVGPITSVYTSPVCVVVFP